MSVLLLEARYYRATQTGQRRDELTRWIANGVVTMNEDTVPPFALTFDCRRPDLLTRYVDWIIPEVTLSYPDGTRLTEPLGLYRVLKTPASHTGGGSTVRVTCEDMTGFLARSRVSIPYTVPKNSNPLQIIADNLTYVGFSVDQLALPPTTERTPADRTFDPGTSRRDIFVELANGAGFRTPWGNRYARLTASPFGLLEQTAPAATYTNAHAPGERSLLLDRVDEDHDDSRLCNLVTVRKITPGEPPVYYTAINRDPASPVNIYGPFGIMAREPIDEPELASIAAAKAKAEALLSEGKSFYHKATIATVPDPRFDLFQTIALDYRGPDGAVLLDGVWWRRTLHFPLTPRGLAQGCVAEINRVELWGGGVAE